MNPEFWLDRRVFVTGHTGFKGAWLSMWLEQLGAQVTGYGLAPGTDPALFNLLAPWPRLASTIGDVRDPAGLAAAVTAAEPEIVIHLAAQSLVRRSYDEPAETFSTNVLGTVNLLDALRTSNATKAVLVITSDKVYDQAYGGSEFVESDRLGGADPYSASKAAQELVTASYRLSFFEEGNMRIATARAGNVIGGGDWAADRLIPDYFRALSAGEPFQLRYPAATRPWQHVLEPLNGYLTYLEYLSANADVPSSLNFGTNEAPVVVADIVAQLAKNTGQDSKWSRREGGLWPEHTQLGLDSSTATEMLGWRPVLPLDDAISWTAAWYQAHRAGQDMRAFSSDQIAAFTRRIA